MVRAVVWGLSLLLAVAADVHGEEREFTGSSIFNFNNYADNTPGAEFLERGNRFYEQGDYDAAVGNFRLAARWADKMAQFNLGMLYVNGQGVERDPLRGWAWMELSAERGYPVHRQAADSIFNQFTDEHRELARQILEEELKPEFGDEAAVARTQREMERRLHRVGARGSRVGANRVLYVETRDGLLESGEQYYHPDRWDFEKIIAFETRLAHTLSTGTVTLGELELIDDEDEARRDQDRNNGDG
ncbi:MAG: tetratricopeptide repeat protein [Wenzhouxiangellaceae bacterium]